jgi:hypothetical protein
MINKFYDIYLNNYMIRFWITGYLDFVQHQVFYGTHKKVKLSLCLTNKHYPIKMYGGVDV